jgi:hypothetical protein
MIVSAYQPYFSPYPGFFAKALMSDILVLMDGVQFPRGTSWLTRNRFKNDQGTLWITIPVWKKGLGFQAIHDVRICNEGRWARKHLESLKTAYANAPFFEEHRTFLQALFSEETDKLVDLNLAILKHSMKTLQISTKIFLHSELGIKVKEPELSVVVGRELGASRFLAQNSARKYLDEKAFERAGIELRFFNPRPLVYPQLWGPFISNLSTFDLLFNCGQKAREIIEKGLNAPKFGASYSST